MVGEKLGGFLGERDPVIRKMQDKLSHRAQKIRNRPGMRVKQAAPELPNRNVGDGVAAGTLQAAIAIILEDTVGIPFGSETEIADLESKGDGVVYTVNVNSPTQNMAETKAFFESTTGFTSLLTDLMDVENVEVANTRVLRDTYQIKIKVDG